MLKVEKKNVQFKHFHMRNPDQASAAMFMVVAWGQYLSLAKAQLRILLPYDVFYAIKERSNGLRFFPIKT